METCEELILAGFEEVLLCLVPEFPASRLPLPGSEEARLMSVGSGRQLSMLLNQSSPLGAFSKILLESSLWTSSAEYCYVWNRLDTRFALSAFQLTPLEQSTDGSGSSLWPTATTVDAGCSTEWWLERQAYWRERGQDLQMALSVAAKIRTQRLWRTPDANGGNRGSNDGEKRLKDGHALTLNDQVKTSKLWPTPTVPNGGRRNPEGTSITGRKPDGGKAQIDLREFAIRTQEDHPLSGSLNPRFCEELMGFPIDHTALKHSETRSVPSRPIRSLQRSQKLSD